MIKKIFLTLTLSFFLTTSVFSAGSSDSSSSKTKTDYDKAVSFINSAKKYEKNGKNNKATKKYEKALKLLVKFNTEKPNNPNALNYLGFTSRKLGDFSKGEKYYLQGLAIDPNHVGINEYLGELYFITDRVDLAKERLKILSSCNCDEYNELKEIIEGKKKSKY